VADITPEGPGPVVLLALTGKRFCGIFALVELESVMKDEHTDLALK